MSQVEGFLLCRRISGISDKQCLSTGVIHPASRTSDGARPSLEAVFGSDLGKHVGKKKWGYQLVNRDTHEFREPELSSSH